jgi:hypothetical protein
MEYILSQGHLQEMRRYMDFFAQKRKETLNEIEAAFNQTLKKSSKDEILSWSEVESLISDLKSELKSTVDSELQNVVYMSGVYIKILMSQAEASNLNLQGDLSFIENEKAIEEMKNIGKAPEAPKKLGARLPTLNANTANEQLASARLKEVTDELNASKKKNKEQQVEITALLEELSKFRSHNEGLEEVKEVSQALEETKVKVT